MERVQIQGLPKGSYQVFCKTKKGWRKLIQTVLLGCNSGGSDGNYYQFTEDGKWNLSGNKFKNVEEVTYDDWKQAIETHIRKVGDFKVGDLVYITKGYFDVKEGDVRALDGFDGMHWWIKTKEYPKIFLDKDQNFRHATKEEIVVYEKKSTPKTEFKVGDWVTTTSKKDNWTGFGGLSGDVGTTFQIAEINEQGSIWYRKTKGGHDGVMAQSLRFATFEEIVGVQGKPLKPASAQSKSEPVVRKDGWKVGDKLPVEFLNLCTYYTKAHDIYTGTNAEDDEEKWDNDRVVAIVTSKGWAQISGTSGAYYLSPKHEYLEYDHYENPKATSVSAPVSAPVSASVSAPASNIMVTKDNAVVGLEVVRGRDWDYGDQDHFEGKPGTGIIIDKYGYFPSNKNTSWVTVKWKGGRTNSYLIGTESDDDDASYDLYVYQGSTEQVKEPAKEPVKSTCFDVKGKDRLQIPVGWKPGDSWRHRDGTCGLSISVHPKDNDFNRYFVDFGEQGTAWVTVNQINEFVADGHWIINPEQKSKEKEKEEKQSQTIIISKQTNTKTEQDENIKESSIGISITEQCFITSGSYKFSKATYVPGDEERITKGQRRQGSTVRG